MKYLLFAILSLSLFSACTKSDATPNNGSGGSGSFTWTEDGGTTITADSAIWTTGTWGTGIRAYKGGTVQYFEINWSTQNNTSSGAKTLDAQMGFSYIKNGLLYVNRSAETLTVSGFSNNQLSGNFTLTGLHIPSAAQIRIVATFTNLIKR